MWSNFVSLPKIISNQKMMNLIGTYECKTDAKGRFMMPSSLKKQLNSVVNEGFVLKSSVLIIALSYMLGKNGNQWFVR